MENSRYRDRSQLLDSGRWNRTLRIQNRSFIRLTNALSKNTVWDSRVHGVFFDGTRCGTRGYTVCSSMDTVRGSGYRVCSSMDTVRDSRVQSVFFDEHGAGLVGTECVLRWTRWGLVGTECVLRWTRWGTRGYVAPDSRDGVRSDREQRAGHAVRRGRPTG
jgi:hypothetical protein